MPRNNPTTGGVNIRDINKTPDRSKIDALIPEVWNITITVKSLIPETQNLFYHSISKNSGIYTTEIVSPGDQGKSSVTGALNKVGELAVTAKEETGKLWNGPNR